jgi:hypothetical protein
MNSLESRPFSGRRSFFKAILPGGALLCLGGQCLLGASQFEEKAKQAGQKHKFLEDSGMSFSEVFKRVHADRLPLMRGLEREIGNEKFIVMLKRIIDENAKQRSADIAKKTGKNDLASFTQGLRQPNRYWQNVLTFQVIEDTPRAFEGKVTECLWAKTYRDANAADLGYVLSCHGDYASAEGFNPKMRMIRTKTLMQGDDFCNHRYVVEG